LDADFISPKCIFYFNVDKEASASRTPYQGSAHGPSGPIICLATTEMDRHLCSWRIARGTVPKQVEEKDRRGTGWPRFWAVRQWTQPGMAILLLYSVCKPLYLCMQI